MTEARQPSRDVPGLQIALLSPRSVALVGASDDPAKTAGRPLAFLRRAGYAGRIYPVNPSRKTVQGEPAWPSVAALPEVPDHAYILTPTESVLAAVEECAAAGVPVVSILASGFSESGPAGWAREEQLRAICARTGIRILGPSSLGLVNVAQRLILSANAAFAEPGMPVGDIFVASHSGSMLGALVSRGMERGIGFAGLVSVGSEADLCIGEICAATLDDPGIGGYLLFLETIRKAPALRAFALAAAAAGRPVIAYKLGRSAAAAELAISHTGALAGEDDVADAFLKDCGIARVESLEALIEGMPLLRRMPARTQASRPGRVGVVTTTGGGAAMVVDQLGVRGIPLAPPSVTTFARLAHAGVTVAPGSMVDLTLAGTRYDIMKATLDVMLSAPEFDLVVAVVGSSARHQPELAVRPIVDSDNGKRPLATFLVPGAQQALQLLTQAGVPNFRTPEACADAIAAAFARRVPRALPQPAELPLLLHRREVSAEGEGNGDDGGQASSTGMLDELASYALLDRLGVPRADCVVMDVASALQGVALAHGLSYPLVAKLLSAEVAHKTDVGGVVLNIGDQAGLAQAVAAITANVAQRRAGTDASRILLQSMACGLGEVLIGYRVDAQVGPIVMLAAGGVLTEIYRDRSVRLAPVTLDIAHEMIAEVKALRALAGYRGKPAGDLDALACALVALSALAADPDVAEAEVNPLLVRAAGQGVLAVDAVVRLAPRSPAHSATAKAAIVAGAAHGSSRDASIDPAPD
jgi:acyl-CoA synthetase (NDP forming)